MKSCTSFNKFIRFIEPIDMAALGSRYDCAGRKIRFRWAEDSISLGGRFDFVGWKSQFRWLNNMAALAERSSSVSRMKHLSYQNEAAWCNTIRQSVRRSGLAVQPLLKIKEGASWTDDAPSSLDIYTSFMFFSSQPSNCMMILCS